MPVPADLGELAGIELEFIELLCERHMTEMARHGLVATRLVIDVLLDIRAAARRARGV